MTRKCCHETVMVALNLKLVANATTKSTKVEKSTAQTAQLI